MLHRLLHKRPTKNSKIPISPLHAQKSSGSRLGSLSFRWAFVHQSLEHLLFSSFFNSVCFATLQHREFQGLSCNHYLCCYLPFVIPVAGTQIWLQHLVLSSQLQIQHSIRHRAPVLPALPPSLQVRLLFPRLFQLTAHLVVLQLSLLFLPHPLQTCLQWLGALACGGTT